MYTFAEGPSALRYRVECHIKNHLLHLMDVLSLPLPSPSNVSVFMSDSCLRCRHKSCLKAINCAQAPINILLNGSNDIHQGGKLEAATCLSFLLEKSTLGEEC